MDTAVEIWRTSLAHVLEVYERRRGALSSFIPRLFAFFVLLNAACYWVGLLVAYPDKMRGPDATHYFALQFPVGILGAVFDTASFFATIAIVRRALTTRNTLEYAIHLSLDVVIAALATFWVLFVFSASGWIMSHIEAQPELLRVRNATYHARLEDALKHPLYNWRNLYFGAVMGVSASLPTLMHIGMFARAWLRRDTRADNSSVAPTSR